jgi:prepilin-type N-terminal cleavage/methylation domain-containing protein
MRRTAKRSTRGVTLPEILAAMLVFSVIVGSVSAIYTTAMRTWYIGAAENYAEQKASLALQRMVPDLQQGLSVTEASSPYNEICIAIQLPAKTYDSGEGVYLNQVGTDAEGKPYLIEGDYAVYYRGNEYGHISLTGDRIWRRVVRASDGATLRQQELADNVIDNPPDATGTPMPMFIYWPDIYRLRSVEVTVTVQEEYGHRTATKTMNGELSLRNN